MLVPPDPPRSNATIKQVARRTPVGVWVIVAMAIFFIVAGLGVSAFIILKAFHEPKVAIPAVARENATATPESSGEAGVEHPAVGSPTPFVDSSSEITGNSDPAEEEETRQEVLSRIDVKKDLSERDKDQLYAQVEKSRGFSKIAVIPFAEGKTSPAASQIEALVSRIRQPDVQEKLKDPTTLLVVLGFADLRGDEAKNLEISRDRADNVIRELRAKTELLNVIHPVPMGGQSLIDSAKPERNRLVEVWIAQP
jgi:outer membrane protein OmpA-like peptidoglycan-associated protein